MGADTTCEQRWPELSLALCSWSVGLMVFRTGWWERSSAGFSSILCREIRMQPPLSEPRSCLPLSQQPLGRWQGDGWYLQPGCTAPPRHTNTHTLSLVLCLTQTHTEQTKTHLHTHVPILLSLSSYSLVHLHKHTLSYRQYGYLSNSTLSLLPLAAKPISDISGGMKTSQMKTRKIFWRETAGFLHCLLQWNKTLHL